MPSAAVAINAANANAIISAPGSGWQIRVEGYVLVADNAVSVTWQAGTSNISGTLKLAAAGSSLVAPLVAGHGARQSWFDCGDNTALNIYLSAGVAVGGHVTYEIVPA